MRVKFDLKINVWTVIEYVLIFLPSFIYSQNDYYYEAEKNFINLGLGFILMLVVKGFVKGSQKQKEERLQEQN